jgi:hypothetical protein
MKNKKQLINKLETLLMRPHTFATMKEAMAIKWCLKKTPKEIFSSYKNMYKYPSINTYRQMKTLEWVLE